MSIQDESWKEIVEHHTKLTELGKQTTKELKKGIERSEGLWGSFRFPAGSAWLHSRKKTDPGYYVYEGRRDSKDMQLVEDEGYLPSLKQLKEWEELTKDEGY